MSRLLEEKNEQISKYLTIDEIMPTWCQYFDLVSEGRQREAYEFAEENDLHIGRCARCCVGEAWNWNPTYDSWYSNDCGVCDSFAFYGNDGDSGFMYLYPKIMNGKVGQAWRQTPTVEMFVEHFNKVHVK